jgi:hypothetical protein
LADDVNDVDVATEVVQLIVTNPAPALVCAGVVSGVTVMPLIVVVDAGYAAPPPPGAPSDPPPPPA